MTATTRGRIAAAAIALLTSAALMPLGAGAAAAATSGGPVVLMGIDAEDGGPGGHGPLSVYVDVVESILAESSGGDGIAVIGANGCDAGVFWDAIGVETAETIDYLNGAEITTADFAPYQMVAVASSSLDTCGGITEAENNLFTERRIDIADYVNSGRGLLGFNQQGLSQPYGYISGLGSFTFSFPDQYRDITPTADGLEIGITDALDICCWHDEYDTFPAFLSVLATNAVTGEAAALGGANVVLPGAITLDPATATLDVGATHTVTATVLDGDGNPVAGELVTFQVTGANTATGTATTDADGRAVFSYVGTVAGTDSISASFDDDGDIRTATAEAIWELRNLPPVCTTATAGPSVWPPNHKLVPVTITGITDPDGDPVTVTVTSIYQDEPVNTAGDGSTAVDGAGVGTSTALIRAERSGSPKVPGNGRVYHVSFTAADGNGGTCSGTVQVSVPHDQRGAAAKDDGPLYDSTRP
ncbi:Ig-like domain-containing protein [Rathayibacter sp. SD072]|uniref:Ig-like domain-containing protein n=1 Tax=Rathayibacter sp. SD072 TaxID=2781731 RepID=UPI001A961A10|nr:Ig-like domain-containing protein [Rathayibacter sp. SD072]MBO0985804.1 Ig-like domain-containing protein [Rathayibacter sp. SD072]